MRGGAPEAAATVCGVYRRSTELGDIGCDDKERKEKKNAQGHTTFRRLRVQAGEAVPVTRDGLADSVEWHRSDRAVKILVAENREPDLPPPTGEERAVLVQSAANLTELREREWDPVLKWRAPSDSLVPGSFGENIFLDALQYTELCIGDTFTAEREGKKTGLILSVSSPRRPCASVDALHGQVYGDAGVRAHCARTGAGGWFARVLGEGAVMEGDVLRLTARPHAEWPLDRVSRLLYGRAAKDAKYDLPPAAWCGSRAELEAMAGLAELARYEWRDEARRLLAAAAEGAVLGGPWPPQEAADPAPAPPPSDGPEAVGAAAVLRGTAIAALAGAAAGVWRWSRVHGDVAAPPPAGGGDQAATPAARL